MCVTQSGNTGENSDMWGNMDRSVLKNLHSTLEEHSRTGNVPKDIGDSFLVVAEVEESYKVSGS